MRMTRVLVIRPEPGASATVKRARERGLDAVCAPLFKIEPVAWNAPNANRFDGLLVTSANAIRHGGENLGTLQTLEVFAVGKATAAAARKAGFGVKATGDSGADQLLKKLDPHLRLLHLCGEDRREPCEPRQEITQLIVYRSRPIGVPDLSNAQNAIALVHSLRAAQRLAELVTERNSVRVAAISNAVAEAAGTGWKSVDVSTEPTDDALLALAAMLCNKPDPK